MLDLTDKALNKMAFLVQMGIILTLFKPALTGRNDGNSPSINNQV